VSNKTAVAQDRVFSDDKKIFHDLFKLLVAKMYKNLSWQPIPEDEYTAIEHCHFFHTFDSSGKKQVHSTSVGGHFHIMEIIEEEGKTPKVLCKSGPLKYIRKKNRKTRKYERVAVPVNEVDTHKHTVVYLQSNVLKFRKINDEAVKVIGKNAQLATKPTGLDVTMQDGKHESKVAE